ncbi:MAG: type II toxin-antitoxin system RatA family toxin [Parvularculaceae bacterium]
MTTRRTRSDVPYSAAQMFDLVADVERYPEFLPWCVGLRVVKHDITNGSGTITTDMIVAYKMFREQFRTHDRFDREAKVIEVDYANGPFRHLHNVWRFEDREEGGSTVDFEISFEFRNVLLQATAKAVFEKAFARMSEAFIERANEIYGAASTQSAS